MNAEQRERLKKKVEDMQREDVSLGTCRYGSIATGCYCAVGFLAQDQPDILNDLLKHNGDAIDSQDLNNARNKLCVLYGLTYADIKELQQINDSSQLYAHVSYANKQTVIEYLTSLTDDELIYQ